MRREPYDTENEDWDEDEDEDKVSSLMSYWSGSILQSSGFTCRYSSNGLSHKLNSGSRNSGTGTRRVVA